MISCWLQGSLAEPGNRIDVLDRGWAVRARHSLRHVRAVPVFRARSVGRHRHRRIAGAGDGEVSAGLIAEAAAGGVLAALDVIDGHLDALGGHIAAEILGRTQGHDLPAGDADVAVIAGHGIAPAAAVLTAGALSDQDHLDRLD